MFTQLGHRDSSRATCTSVAKQSAAVGTCGGRLAEARVTTWTSPKGAVEGRPPRASAQGCAVARPGVCNETGRNSEPGANPAETLATRNPTHSRDTTLAQSRFLRACALHRNFVMSVREMAHTGSWF